MNATNEKEIMAMTNYTTLEVENFKGIREMKLEGLPMSRWFAVASPFPWRVCRGSMLCVLERFL
jgi:hypothetical protein